MQDGDFDFGFEGIQETPIPDMFGEEPVSGVDGSPPQAGGVADDFGEQEFSAPQSEEIGGGPIMPSDTPPRRTRPRPQSLDAGVPDPSHPVQRPERQKRDYNAASMSGVRAGRTQQMHQGYTQPGQSIGDDSFGDASDFGLEASSPQAPPKRTQPQQAQPQQKRQRAPLPGYQPSQGGQSKRVVRKGPDGRMMYGDQPVQFGPLGQPYALGADGNYIFFAPNGTIVKYGPQGQPYMDGPDGKPIMLAPNCKPIQYGPNGEPYMTGQDGKRVMLDENGQMLPDNWKGGKKGKKEKAQKQPKSPRQPKQNAPAGSKPPKPPKQGGKKRLPILPILVVILLVIIVAVVAMKLVGGKRGQEPVQLSYESSGRWALDTLKSALNSYNPESMDAVIGVEDGDSYLAKEWAYVNNVKIRQEFLQKVGALVQFEYPRVQQMAVDGSGMVDDAGNPIMIESYMNNGEEFTVTIPDYDKLAKTMDEKAEYILQMLASARYSENDYLWPDELTNLMLQFILDDGPLPTKQVQCSLPIRANTSGRPYIESDANLDDLLFGSEEFRYMAAKFSQICVGWTGYIEETYLTYEREHNEEYDRWLELFLAYFEADGGVYNPDGDPKFTNVQKAFKRNKSKWEPWYLREPDNPNVIQKYPDGTYIVNYFTVKDANGNDWIQPAEQIEKEVENIRLLDDPWEEETGIWYNWLGMHWLETQYHGRGSIVTRVGDGTREHPAGIGTTIVTKVLGTDGMYHDVKVALMGYWTGQSGIDYAEKFSSRNRGFTVASVVQLICYEVYVENLESEPIEFEASEMTLTDRNSNISSRTGTMYDFTGVVHLEARDPKGKRTDYWTILNDWATSTELSQKYVCWGKSFGRQFNMVYFDCLAGTGNIPSYSAYKAFTGQSSIDEEITH